MTKEFNPKEARALVKRLLAFAWDYPCVHCGSPVLEINSRGQITCIGCLNENPSDPQSQTICEAADALTAALDEIERLRQALKPFSEEASWWFVRNYNAEDIPVENFGDYESVMTCGDLFNARAALEGTKR